MWHECKDRNSRWFIHDRTNSFNILKPYIQYWWDQCIPKNRLGAYGKEGDKYWVNLDGSLEILYADTEEEAKALLLVISHLS
jgi:hypothetical protein